MYFPFRQCQIIFGIALFLCPVKWTLRQKDRGEAMTELDWTLRQKDIKT